MNGYVLCGICGDKTDLHSTLVAREQFICPGCFSTHHQQCNLCRNWQVKSAISMQDNEPICSSCSSHLIRGHWSRPKNWFHGSGPLFFGVELEVDDDGDKRKVTTAYETIAYRIQRDFRKLVYVEVDTSLKRGLEFIFHPFSWEWYKANENVFKEFLTAIKSYNFRSFKTETCGMHVHITEKAIQPLTQYKMAHFIFENPEFCLAISRRTRARLDKQALCHVENTGKNILDNVKAAMTWLAKYDVAKGVKGAKKKVAFSRSEELDMYMTYISHIPRKLGLNFVGNGMGQLPPKTLEFRIFQGTTDYGYFAGNLEFCKAVVDFCNTSSLQELGVPQFREFIKNKFPYLEKAVAIALNEPVVG